MFTVQFTFCGFLTGMKQGREGWEWGWGGGMRGGGSEEGGGE